MLPEVSRNRRAFVAELGFELFRASSDAILPIAELGSRGSAEEINPDTAAVEAAATLVRARIAKLSALEEDEVPAPSPVERTQAVALANRLRTFVQQRWASSFTVDPEISGCGIIDGARADLLITRAPFPFGLGGGTTSEHLLYEVKTVARPFRAIDLRQLITYAALMAANSEAPVTVGIVNPRLGTFVECPLDRLAVDISGLRGNQLLQQIIFDVSEAEISL